MSSRNQRLNKEERKNAPHIYKTLLEAQNKAGQMGVEELRKWVVEAINENKFLETEYFEITDNEQLIPASSWNNPVNKVGCIAVGKSLALNFLR